MLFESAAAVGLRKEIQGEWLLALSGVLSTARSVLLVLFHGPGAMALVIWMGAFRWWQASPCSPLASDCGCGAGTVHDGRCWAASLSETGERVASSCSDRSSWSPTHRGDHEVWPLLNILGLLDDHDSGTYHLAGTLF